jgi:predicted RecB family nuclease
MGGVPQDGGELIEARGETPWVHWSPYERTYLRKYIDRYGDRDHVAERVDANLVDLLGVTKNALALPVPSYGLKVIEDYVGYRRAQRAYGGTWSIAQFIEAVECDDEARREELHDEICTYNREDVEATWAVFEWVRSHAAQGR